MTAAILGCLVLAGIGLACGVPAFDCTLRALGGAVVIYFVVGAAGRMIVSIMVDAVIKAASNADSTKNGGSGNAR